MKLFIALTITTFVCIASAGVISKREETDCNQMAYDIQGYVKHYEKGLRQFAKKKATNDMTQNEAKTMQNASKAADTLTTIMHTFQTTCYPHTAMTSQSLQEMDSLYKGIHQSCKGLVQYHLDMNKHLPLVQEENAELNSATDAVINRCLNPNTPRFFS
ncbi:hypothetical protein K501DRAFT_267290 [Backusella circina FSU 941]|nr:hypothetical protein K501DRAFT_267290 [Backusella circina FSU 941]